jgi:iron complex transport system substrate-binding protein
MRLRGLCLAAVLGACAANAPAAERVVTLSPHLAELVCAVGACEQLVGVVKYSDFPSELKARPQVGDAFTVNAEAVLALRPSLILSWDGGTPARTVTQLQRLGLNVEAVRVRTLEDVGAALLRVGALLAAEDQACAAEAEYRGRIEALRARYAGAAPIEVMYQLEPEPVFTINRESPISEALALCGGRNIFADRPRLAGPVSREAVMAADPAAIVFGVQDDVAGIRAGWARFTGLRAVRSGNLIAVDADTLARATPRMAEGAEALCDALDAARKRLAQAAAR